MITPSVDMSMLHDCSANVHCIASNVLYSSENVQRCSSHVHCSGDNVRKTVITCRVAALTCDVWHRSHTRAVLRHLRGTIRPYALRICYAMSRTGMAYHPCSPCDPRHQPCVSSYAFFCCIRHPVPTCLLALYCAVLIWGMLLPTRLRLL